MKKKTFPFSLVLLLTFFGLLFFLPTIDTDLGWHLRYGNYFLETGKPLKTNEFTFLLPGYHWPNSYFGYQVLVAAVYNVSGFLGFSLANSFFFTLLALFIFWYFDKKLLPCLLTLLVISFLGISSLRLGLRSQNFTLLGVTFLLYLFKLAQKDSRYLFAIPPLIGLWANLHGGFVLGLAVFGFFVLDRLLAKDQKLVIKSIPVFLLAVLAGTLTPYGAKVYQEVWRHAYYPLKFLIAEWVPPTTFWRGIILAMGAISLVLLAKQKKKSPFLFLLILFFAWQALYARRNLPLFGLVLGIIWTEYLMERLFLKKAISRIEKTTLLPITLASFVFLLLLTRVPSALRFVENDEAICSKGMASYPCQAIDWVKKQPFLGRNSFATYEWSGFLEWKLPEYKFFVDGRMPAWPTPSGKSPYTIYLEILQARPGWEKELEKYNTDWLLIAKGTFLDLGLEKGHPTWQLTYQDKGASIYTKRK